MNAYFDGKVIFNDIPDVLSIGDTIISKDDKIYSISTKTFDVNNKELYCKLQIYTNISDEKSVVSILEDIYESPYFETSGANTNEIDNNPRIIILIGILSTIMDDKDLVNKVKLYKETIILRWNDINISWNDILTDNPISTRSLKQALPIIKQVLTNTKISPTMWPIKLQNQFNSSI